MYIGAGYQINSILNQGIQTTIYQIETPEKQHAILKLLQSEYPTLEATTRLKYEYQIQKDIVKALKLETFDHRLGILLEDFSGESLAQINQTEN